MKTKKDLFYAAAAVTFAVAAVAYTFWGYFNLGATLSCLLFLLLSTCYLADRTQKPGVFSCLCGGLALFSSLVYTLSTDVLFKFLGIPLILGLTAIYLSGLGANLRYWQGGYKIILDIVRTLFILPLAHLGTVMKNLFARAANKRPAKIWAILLGVCAAFPILLIVIPLLIRADAAFSDLMLQLAENLSDTLAQIILGLLLAPFIITLLYSLKKGLDKPCQAAEKTSKIPSVNSVGVVSFLSAICFCYLIYLFSQLAYFFNGFAGILPNSWNVVDYAKRGFFEICVIAAINLTVVFASSALVSRRKAGILPVSVKALNLFISFFTLLLIATAQAKMVMYIQDFGMTRLRLLTSLFMGLLMLIYFAVILRLFIRRFPYMKAIIIAGSVVFLAAWGLTPIQKDINALVCEYNISAYTKGELDSFDLSYLSSLGSSSTFYLIEIADDTAFPTEIREQARGILRQRAEEKTADEKGGLKSYNYIKSAEAQALRHWTVEHKKP